VPHAASRAARNAAPAAIDGTARADTFAPARRLDVHDGKRSQAQIGGSP
jgi:hypothetical protein